MTLRSFLSILAGLVLGLLVCSGIGAYWLGAHPILIEPGSIRRAPPPVDAATVLAFVPRQAPWIASLSMSPDRLLARTEPLVPPRQRRAAQLHWQRLWQPLLDYSQLNYARDLQPWLGDQITLALTTEDLDRDATNGQQPGYLLVATPRDARQAQRSLQRYWQRRSRTVTRESYAGVTITSNVDSAAARLATAVVGNQAVLLANHPKVIRDALNNALVPELGFAQSDSYQQAREQLDPAAIGIVFTTGPALTVPEQTTDGSPLSAIANSALTAPTPWMIYLQPDGFTGHADQLLPPSVRSAVNPEILAAIPATSAVVAVGRSALPSSPDGQEPSAGEAVSTSRNLLHQIFQSLAQHWQLASSEPLVDWIQGDYAIGILPRADRAHPDWIVVAERSTATSPVEQLSAFAQAQGVSSGTVTIGNQSVRAWTKLSIATPAVSTHASSRRIQGQFVQPALTLQAEAQAAYASLESPTGMYDLVASSLDAMAQALSSPPSIQSVPAFQEALQRSQSSLTAIEQDWMYVNWPILESILSDRNLESSHPSPITVSSALYPILHGSLAEVQTIVLYPDTSDPENHHLVADIQFN